MSVAGLNVQLQLLASTGYPHWPSEVVEIEQRYSDVRPAQLRVLTSPAFAAAKLLAWWDRGTSRDLYDLWAMAVRGMVDHEAAELFSRHGPLRHATDVPFSQLPTGAEWEAALGHQCILQVTVQEAADVVREAWKSV